MPDQFGGIEIAPPPKDKFGGVRVGNGGITAPAASSLLHDLGQLGGGALSGVLGAPGDLYETVRDHLTRGTMFAKDLGKLPAVTSSGIADRMLGPAQSPEDAANRRAGAELPLALGSPRGMGPVAEGTQGPDVLLSGAHAVKRAAGDILPGGVGRAQAKVTDIAQPQTPSVVGDMLRNALDKRLTAAEKAREESTAEARSKVFGHEPAKRLVEESGSNRISDTANAFVERLKSEFPNARVWVDHSRTSVGDSSYVHLYERESPESQSIRHRQWEDAKGTKRGPPPGQRMMNLEWRVSDHGTGVTRTGQYHGHFHGDMTHGQVDDVAAQVRAAAPWIGGGKQQTLTAIQGRFLGEAAQMLRSGKLDQDEAAELHNAISRVTGAKSLEVIDKEGMRLKSLGTRFAGDLGRQLESHFGKEVPDYTAYKKLYAEKSGPINDFEKGLGKKITGETEKYRPGSFSHDSATLPAAAFKSRDSVRALKKLSGGDTEWVEANARAHAASQLDRVTQEVTGVYGTPAGKGYAQANVAAKWARANADWLNEVPGTKKAVDDYVAMLRHTAHTRAAAAGASAFAFLMAKEGVDGLYHLRHLPGL